MAIIWSFISIWKCHYLVLLGCFNILHILRTVAARVYRWIVNRPEGINFLSTVLWCYFHDQFVHIYHMYSLFAFILHSFATNHELDHMLLHRLQTLPICRLIQIFNRWWQVMGHGTNALPGYTVTALDSRWCSLCYQTWLVKITTDSVIWNIQLIYNNNA